MKKTLTVKTGKEEWKDGLTAKEKEVVEGRKF
jgi:hypothetical protein